MSVKNRICIGLLMTSAVQGVSTASLAQELSTELKAEAQESSAPQVIPSHGAIPEGKVLPKGVVRSWILHRHYSSNMGFDETGSRVSFGLKRHTAVTGLVGEYGITDRLSFRMLVPVIYRNQMSLDQKQFRNSETFKKLYNDKANKVAAQLQAKGFCQDIIACRNLVDSGDIAPPVDSDVIVESGETFTFSRHDSFKNQLENSILKGATPALNGPTGLGDVEAGVLYSVVKQDNLLVSAGLGVRAPTGNFDVPEMSRPTSGGIYDLGLRFNFDYSPLPGLWLSYQEQLEQGLSKATWKRSSMIDNDTFNEKTPIDGIDNSQTYSKFGIGQASLLKANYGFGGAVPSLKFLAMNVKYMHVQERAVRLNGEESVPGVTTAKHRSTTQSVGGGIGLSGLPYQVPVDFEVNYMAPVAGSYNKVASGILESYLRVYARF